jgi:hypothetical protein
MNAPRTKPCPTQLRTPKAKRRLGLSVPMVRLPHDFLIHPNLPAGSLPAGEFGSYHLAGQNSEETPTLLGANLPASTSPAGNLDPETSTLGTATTIDNPPAGNLPNLPAGNLPNPPAGNLPAQLKNTSLDYRHIPKSSSSSAAEFPCTRQALTQFPDIHPSDQDILDLVHRCQAVCPGTQNTEISDFVRLKGSTLKTEAIKTSRMALLLKIVPQCLTGETLRLYRKRKLDETESQRVQEVEQLAGREQMDRFWEETLRDPKQTPDTKRSAMAYFRGIIEKADIALERRRRAEEVVRRFRGAGGTL